MWEDHVTYSLGQATLENGRELERVAQGCRRKLAVFQANPPDMDPLSGLALFPGRWDSETMALSSGGSKANVCGWAWLDLSHPPWGLAPSP